MNIYVFIYVYTYICMCIHINMYICNISDHSASNTIVNRITSNIIIKGISCIINIIYICNITKY